MSHSTQLADDLPTLRREVADRLGLAIAAGAPWSLLEKLGAASGLLQALAEVPSHALVRPAMDRARQAMRAFRAWQEALPRRLAA